MRKTISQSANSMWKAGRTKIIVSKVEGPEVRKVEDGVVGVKDSPEHATA